MRAAREEAHDGRRPHGHGGHHEPDPLRGGAEIRARHAGPICKGVDAVALKIRAGQRSIGSRSSRILPLARALHATVQIDQEIPVEHYKAVAEVIGAILRLRRRPS